MPKSPDNGGVEGRVWGDNSAVGYLRSTPYVGAALRGCVDILIKKLVRCVVIAEENR